MASLRLLGVNRRGITLLELIVVLGLLAIIFMIGLPTGIDFYNTYQFRAEINTVASLLEQARSKALTNNNESNWGFYIDYENFVIFEGDSYAERDVAEDRIFDRADTVNISGPGELVFEQLSGRVASSTLTISDYRRSVNIFINSEGAVWY
ncbi:MAG: prepilin-type N-terminal cleavage/methylation domain-containing protein [bacterium]|nr:prepilin-type N-terminal cleavage/methylation domain-containing protein [bacterium]